MKKEKKAKEENAEKTGKGGKKKLLLIPLILVVVAAIAAAVVFLILPRFGIQLLGGGDDAEQTKPKGLETYAIEEETVPALDTVLEEGEGELFASRAPDEKKAKKSKDKEDSEDEEDSEKTEDSAQTPVERYTYIYELTSPASAVNRYLDVMLGGEQGFSLVDGEFLIQEDRPELEDGEGKLVLARNSDQEGHVFQVAIGWSQASENLAVRVSAPEGRVHQPEPEPEPEPASLDEHMNQLMTMTPSQLGLPGESMDDYEIYAMMGFVKVDDLDCRRFTFYTREEPGSIAGIYLISSDQQHFYQLDPETNAVTELR